ncbi:hypothetical protein ONZ45_g16137 [Pleurotus djamor]|nr:hypothetical protein ONZ45_g16137 [Pleurotus djamor]
MQIIAEIKTSAEFHSIVGRDQKTLIEFYMYSSGGSIAMASQVHSMSDLKDIHLYRVDVDKTPEVALDIGVRTLFFEDPDV